MKIEAYVVPTWCGSGRWPFKRLRRSPFAAWRGKNGRIVVRVMWLGLIFSSLSSLACAREPAYAEPARCIEPDCGPIRMLDAGPASFDDAGYVRGGP